MPEPEPTSRTRLPRPNTLASASSAIAWTCGAEMVFETRSVLSSKKWPRSTASMTSRTAGVCTILARVKFSTNSLFVRPEQRHALPPPSPPPPSPPPPSPPSPPPCGPFAIGVHSREEEIESRHKAAQDLTRRSREANSLRTSPSCERVQASKRVWFGHRKSQESCSVTERHTAVQGHRRHAHSTATTQTQAHGQCRRRARMRHKNKNTRARTTTKRNEADTPWMDDALHNSRMCRHTSRAHACKWRNSERRRERTQTQNGFAMRDVTGARAAKDKGAGGHIRRQAAASVST
eukprot:scaffold15872_cov122-Isochrysis_galbana.AAC.3